MANPDRAPKTESPISVSKSTNPAQNKTAFYIAIAGAAVAIIAVIGFNVMAPKGRLDAPGKAATGPASQNNPVDTSSGTQASPQRADTPTPTGREAVGAPVGAAPNPSPNASN